MTPSESNWQQIDAKLNELHQQLLDQQNMVAQEIVNAKQLQGDLGSRIDKSERVLEQLKNASSSLDELIGSMRVEKRENAYLLDDLRSHSKLYTLQPEESRLQGNIVWRITEWLRLTLLRWE
jgi:hypothetical protein